MTVRVRTPGSFARARFLGAALLLGTISVLSQAPAAFALSCSGSHTLVLDRGAVTPATGPASGAFTFTVRYRDNANCPPRVVKLRIPGVGTYGMRATARTYKAGVVYSLALALPKGKWKYSFAAASGSGAGAKSVAFSAVKPATVSVTAAVVAPTPGPTPAPGPTPVGSRLPDVSPAASRRPSASGAPASVGGPDDDDSGLGFQIPAIFGGPMGGIVGPWMVLTGLGMAIFWVILRRRPESPMAAGAASAAAAAGGMGGPARTPGSGEDATLPRWLRPSLQAARQAGWGVPPPRTPIRFQDPAAPGVDRREIGYRLVRVADGPDDLASTEIGRFDRGDQVEVLETQGPFVRVRGADGLEGWVQHAAIVSILDN